MRDNRMQLQEWFLNDKQAGGTFITMSRPAALPVSGSSNSICSVAWSFEGLPASDHVISLQDHSMLTVRSVLLPRWIQARARSSPNLSWAPGETR